MQELTVNQIEGITLRKSVFGHLFINTGQQLACFYHSITMERIFVPLHIVDILLKMNGKDVSSLPEYCNGEVRDQACRYLLELCAKNIYVPDQYNELTYLESIKRNLRFEPNIREMILHLTDFCNLKCSYCFIEGGIQEDYERRHMSLGIGEQSVLFFEKILNPHNQKKAPAIVFYGGEPLLNWKTLNHLLDFIAERQRLNKMPGNLQKIIITNGTLVTEQIAKKLAEHNLTVAISLDGPKDINDNHRKTVSKSGSFVRALKGYFLLKRFGIKPSVSCVATPESIKELEKVLSFFIDDLQVEGLGFNHISIIPGKNSYDKEYENSFADAIINTQKYFRQKKRNIYERRMGHKIKNFTDRLLLKADCTGCGEQFSVSPLGEVGVCQGYMGSRKTFNHTVFERDYNPNDDEVFKEWSRRSPLNMKQCYNCPALATCGGGCPRNADFTNGSIWEMDTPFCHFGKKSVEWLVWNC